MCQICDRDLDEIPWMSREAEAPRGGGQSVDSVSGEPGDGEIPDGDTESGDTADREAPHRICCDAADRYLRTYVDAPLGLPRSLWRVMRYHLLRCTRCARRLVRCRRARRRHQDWLPGPN